MKNCVSDAWISQMVARKNNVKYRTPETTYLATSFKTYMLQWSLCSMLSRLNTADKAPPPSNLICYNSHSASCSLD